MDAEHDDIFCFLEVYRKSLRSELERIEVRLETLEFHASMLGNPPRWRVFTRFKKNIFCRHIADLECLFDLVRNDFSESYKMQCAFIAREFTAVALFLESVVLHIDYFLSTESGIAKRIFSKTKTNIAKISEMIERLKKMERDKECAAPDA